MDELSQKMKWMGRIANQTNNQIGKLAKMKLIHKQNKKMYTFS